MRGRRRPFYSILFCLKWRNLRYTKIIHVHVKLIYSQSINFNHSLINEQRILQVLTMTVIWKLLLVHVLLEMTDKYVTYIWFDCLFFYKGWNRWKTEGQKMYLDIPRTCPKLCMQYSNRGLRGKIISPFTWNLILFLIKLQLFSLTNVLINSVLKVLFLRTNAMEDTGSGKAPRLSVRLIQILHAVQQ